MMKRLAVLFMLALMSSAAAQQAAEPSETTEKFGAWTVRCVIQQGENATKACEVFLAIQGQSGLIAQIALGNPQDGGALMAGRAPLGVLVSQPLTVATEEGEAAPVTLPFVTCLANGCLAQAVIPGAAIGKLVAKEQAIVTFAEHTGRKIQFNIPTTGLSDALGRIGLDCSSGSCDPVE